MPGLSDVEELRTLLLHTLVALCLGALVGLERQISQEESGGRKDFPGVRTFAFTALLGALAVYLHQDFGPWLAIALFLASSSFLVLRYRYDTAERGDPGYTTEIASLCTFCVGALAQAGQLFVATSVTIAMVALLRSKRALHEAGRVLSPRDMEMGIRFLIITGIVLPLLPNEPIDPLFHVLRPRDVWWMVVLISGVGFLGYVLMRMRAGKGGFLLSGLLSGLVSSTAATLAYTRAARLLDRAQLFEALVVVAAATAFVRMSVELAFANGALVGAVAPQLGMMFATGLGLAFLRHRPRGDAPEPEGPQNPLSLRVAFTFATLYAVVLLLVAAGDRWFAEKGIYALAALGALPGADAPTLSLARLSAHGDVSLEVAARGIGIVAVATTLAKAGLVTTVGRGPFVPRVALSLVLVAAAGAAVLVWQ